MVLLCVYAYVHVIVKLLLLLLFCLTTTYAFITLFHIRPCSICLLYSFQFIACSLNLLLSLSLAFQKEDYKCAHVCILFFLLEKVHVFACECVVVCMCYSHIMNFACLNMYFLFLRSCIRIYVVGQDLLSSSFILQK